MSYKPIPEEIPLDERGAKGGDEALSIQSEQTTSDDFCKEIRRRLNELRKNPSQCSVHTNPVFEKETDEGIPFIEKKLKKMK